MWILRPARSGGGTGDDKNMSPAGVQQRAHAGQQPRQPDLGGSVDVIEACGTSLEPL
ncbi:hypothetical protein Q3V37_17710 [Micromonospora profundi]|uniref:Uncharacterized protein n=1 Tax=Micromonospora profundi TaxID=1420889 RepID=A0AAJ6L126_9ACTN|nr:hypothetical protein [Micromonospora profundi]WLS43256.1 hypothetical protein Q3V37_17710 [Micromonospora profundi]